jgi:hypothetical protein
MDFLCPGWLQVFNAVQMQVYNAVLMQVNNAVLAQVFDARFGKCIQNTALQMSPGTQHCPLFLPRACLLAIPDSRVNTQYIRLF